jgi:hypothetical protein
MYLALAGSALGAGYHHYRSEVFSANDIGFHAPVEPTTV